MSGVGAKELQEYTFKSKYARYLPELKRRENWGEAVNRVRQMMLTFYEDKNIEDHINFAYDMMLEKKVLGSQRCMQFGGDPILRKHARCYNCSFTLVDRPRVFQEIFWTSLCGTGIGYSIQKHHVEKLPDLNLGKWVNKNIEEKVYVIPDSIEGWADAVGVLLSTYFTDPIYKEWAPYKVKFDFSKIRPKGSIIANGVGLAPGPDGLRSALKRIRKLLDNSIKNKQQKLRPIQAHDIICYCADGTLSGGVRRSALIALFSYDDEEMMGAKTGNWFDENPQRARANNSVVLVRNEITEQQFRNIVQKTKEWGEPGFFFTEDNDGVGTNPCQASWSKILTPEGIREFRDIDVGSIIWSSEGWTTVTKKWSTGINEIYKYTTTAGIFYGTKNHRILENGIKIEIDKAESIDILAGPEPVTASSDYTSQYIIDGLVLGDGSVHRASSNLVYLHIGEDDKDYFKDKDIKDLIKVHRPGICSTAWEVKTNIKFNELPKTFERRIPKRYLRSSPNQIRFFLRGLFSANGSVCGNRITLKSSSKGLVEDVQLMLSSIGIRSYYTTNKESTVSFENGDYNCKQSYDLNISVDREKFIRYIGFIQKYKNNQIQIKKSSRVKKTYDIISVELISIEETFDITVDNLSHTYWTQGCNVSNCAEISLYAYDEHGNTGFQFCNLSEVNCATVKDEEDFYQRCEAASILGTLQAGFTKFPYLGEVTERIVEREALLGVSMTGIMNKPEIALDPRIQIKGAEVVKKVNKDLSTKIGINQAARTTCTKPSGTASTILGTSAGIHPGHSPRYIRHVTANRDENIYKFFKQYNGFATEKSVWSSNDTDDMIAFPVELPDGSKTKGDVDGLQMLEYIKSTQQNWVIPGKNKHLCVKPYLNHNVSNTVVVKNDEEWEKIVKYLYKNRKFFTAVSFISDAGDLSYQQAPFVGVRTSHQIITKYGDAGLWVSGLVQLGLVSHNDNLWLACDTILNDNFNKNISKEIKKLTELAYSNGELALLKLKLEFYERARKFAEKYFDGDYRKLTFCLKEVHNWKKFNDLQREFIKVPYDELVEDMDYTKPEEEVACAGGACLI